jgi:type IV pilus assembly protein PilO
MREMLFILLLLAMPVASFLFVFQPRGAQMAEARREIASKQSKLNQLELATRNIEDLGREIDRLTEAIAVFEQKLPAEREVEVILREVAELAAKHNLTLKAIRTDKTVPAANYIEQPLKLNIEGEFDGYYSFLLAIEKLPRITAVRRMVLKKLDEKSDAQMQAEMVLSIFCESANKAAAGGKTL